jgi:hypothetical protein
MDTPYLFGLYVFTFSFLGLLRGWAKELLVAFSVITALAVNLLLEKYIPIVRDLDKSSNSTFWIRILILMELVYFGYQTVYIARFAYKASPKHLRDTLFGALLGGFNGYLIAGSVLFYNYMANYPYPHIISPTTDPVIAEAIGVMMKYMPPRFLGEPGIYFAVIIILIIIIIVYI